MRQSLSVGDMKKRSEIWTRANLRFVAIDKVGVPLFPTKPRLD